MNDKLPFTVGLTASVWPRDYQTVGSMFNPKVPVDPDNLKPFYADPPKLKRAIEELKKVGCRITSVNKYSITFLCQTIKVKEIFNTELAIMDGRLVCQNSADPKVIDVSGLENFNNYIDRILLPVKMSPQYSGKNPPLKTDETQVYPSEMRAKLENKHFNFVQGEGVTVFMTDTGIDVEHPFFEDYKDNIKQKTSIYDYEVMGQLSSTLGEYRKKWQEASRIKRTIVSCPESEKADCLEEIKDKFDKLGPYIFGPDKKQWPPYNEAVVKNLQESFIGLISNINHQISEQLKVLVDKDTLSDGHGTQVAASLLAIAPKVKIIMYKQSANIKDPFKPIGAVFNDLIEKFKSTQGSKIFSSSVAFSESIEAFNSIQMNDYFTKLWSLYSSRIPIIWAVGNDDDPIRAEEPQLNYVLAVGGAYKDLKGKIVASNVSQGYRVNTLKKIVPEICGWCAPQPEFESLPYFLWLPGPDNNWAPQAGTSYAAPQIAGVCAIIKQVWPGIPNINLRNILLLSADPVTEGKFVKQPNKNINLIKYTDDFKEDTMDDFNNNIGKKPGMVNINKAIQKLRISHSAYYNGFIEKYIK